MPRRNWSRLETLMALVFYLCPPLPRKNWDDNDAEIHLLAEEIGRSEAAVCLKIGNLKSCDPNKSGSGFSHAAAMDSQVMGEYLTNPDATMSEAMAGLERIGIQISYDGRIETPAPSRLTQPQQFGLERIAQVRTRVNQDYFRNVLLANYKGTCCLTGVNMPELLTASHIKPWAAATPSERLAASNGLLLNALHDRAFDRGLITLNDDYRVVVSPRVQHTPANDRWLYALAGEKIRLPHGSKSIWPSLDFIHYHNDYVFKRSA